jgi:tRNA pseudouridine32 synthase/23S rRNA pseudouridine746 synthase
LLDFLWQRFPRIDRATWQERLAAGKVLDENGHPLKAEAPCLPGARIQYFREVDQEPEVPFREEILLRTDDLLVADKPHFLPVAPGGKYVNECLLYRLRAGTGIDDLAPLHRLDLDTAGLVLLSIRPETRGSYGRLFQDSAIERTYLAVAESASGGAPVRQRWRVASRIERGEPWFRSRSVAVEAARVNAVTEIELVRWDQAVGRGLFRLRPQTGKTHQLRLHMMEIGFPILHDPLYPELRAEGERDWERPLQLLAAGLAFDDPVTGERRELRSRRRLAFDG